MVTSIITAKLGKKGLKIDLIYMFRFQGDFLNSEDGNFIPILAIIYAAISSLNSVGVSIYQEQLYKVKIYIGTLSSQGIAICQV